MPPLYSNSYTLNGTIYNSCHLQCQFLDQLGVWMPPHRPQYQFQCHKIAPGYESRNLSGRFQSRNLPFITQPPVCHATSPPLVLSSPLSVSVLCSNNNNNYYYYYVLRCVLTQTQTQDMVCVCSKVHLVLMMMFNTSGHNTQHTSNPKPDYLHNRWSVVSV